MAGHGPRVRASLVLLFAICSPNWCWPVTAARAGTPAAFTEEAVLRGVDYFTPGGASQHSFGYGLAFVDLDNDGDPDIVILGHESNQAGVYENDGAGYFTDRSATCGLPTLAGRSGIVALDYDGDGDLDLYITQIDAPNVLARNEGNFVFTDVSAIAGVGDAGRSTGAAIGDYDGDGWLDIYVPNYGNDQFGDPDTDVLYRNQGDGTFIDVAAALGVDDPWRGFQAVFFDMDWDGDSDLYVSNDKKVSTETEMHNRLYENVGGTFEDISSNSGTDVNIYSMGVAVGDFNGNGLQDLYCTNISITEPPEAEEYNVLFINQGGGLFTEEAASAGVRGLSYGWGAVFFDYDNDTHQDLYVCNRFDPNQLFDCDESWPCTDIAPALDVDYPGDSFGVAVADVDLDGDLDFMIQNNGDRVRLYINHEGETRRWVKFNAVGQGRNLFAVGARVRVRSGSLWQEREIIAGGNNYKSQNELVIHVGMGEALMVDQIEVTWPAGSTTRTLANLPTNQTWTLYPPEKLGDADQNGVWDLQDFSVFSECLTGEAPGSIQPGCEVMDFDGDGDNDLRDFAGFQSVFGG